MLLIHLKYKLKTKTMSKTKDAFIRMREQEQFEQDNWHYKVVDDFESKNKDNFIPVNIYPGLHNNNNYFIFKYLILRCINDEEYETTINVCNSDGDFDTDENNVVENVNIEVCCSSLDSIISRIYSFSVSEIVKVCKENGMRFPNEPTLYDIRDCSKEILELLLSR